jgi:allantoinase
MRDMVIRSPRVLLPEGLRAAELSIDGGYISSVRPYDPGAVAVNDAGIPPDGLDNPRVGRGTSDVGPRTAPVVFPGLVDTHVHVNDPGRTEWEGFATASAAAAAGGITTIVDMPLNSVPATTTVAGLEAKRAAARGATINVEFWGGVVPGNAGELDALADAGVRGFKCFLSPSGVDEFPHVNEDDLRAALPILARRNLPLLVHAESPAALLTPSASADARAYATWLASRPPRAEADAIAMLVRLCREYRGPIHVVHVAAAEAIDVIAGARDEGLPITSETCPHYLSFCAEEIAAGQTQFKCAPPIRERAHRDALWRALEDGRIDLIATDHSPCPPAMKGDGDFLGAWGGIASLQLSLAAVWTAASARGIPIERLGQWLSAAPARLAKLNDRGVIAPGMRADFALWDPDAEFVVDAQQLHHRHKLTPYAGMRLRGRTLETYVGGKLVYREGAG